MNNLINKIKTTTIFKRNLRRIKERLLYIWFSFLPDQNLVDKEAVYDAEMIVSFTSFPGRFPTLHIMLKTMMYQTLKPNRFILHLDEGDLTDGEKIVPENINRLQKYGLEIRWHEGNIKSHKKYIYSMHEYPNAMIINIDDDAFYHRNTLRDLYRAHKKYPDDVCARRVHHIKLDADGKLLPYDDWDIMCRTVLLPSNMLVETGVGGTLYPPKAFDDSALETDRILELAGGQDDLWLSVQTLLNGRQLVWAENKHVWANLIPASQKTGLWQSNVDDNANDRSMAKLTEAFNINWADIDKKEKALIGS